MLILYGDRSGGMQDRIENCELVPWHCLEYMDMDIATVKFQCH